MSRDNRKKALRTRADYTGESHQQIHEAMEKSDDGPPWIPGALARAQQLLESTVLHRLVQGAQAQWPGGTRPRHPLFVASASPSAQGLELVVPVGSAKAFGAALAGELAGGLRPSSGDLTIARVYGNTLLITTARTAAEVGAIDLRCAWADLHTGIHGGTGTSGSSADLRLGTEAGLDMTEDSLAVLSGLLRRIVLFTNDSVALDWLFAWHQWLTLGRSSAGPRPPETLVGKLTAEGFELDPVACRVLGIEGPAGPSTAAGPRTPPVPAAAGTARTPVPPATPPTASSAVPPAAAFVDTDRDRGVQPEPAAGVYRHLAVAALRLDPDNPIQTQYHLMRFPHQWAHLLAELEATGRSICRGASFAVLNEAIAAVLPDCVVVSPWDVEGVERYWLLARRPVLVEVIFGLIAAWVRSQKAPDDQIDAVLARLHPSELVWEPIRIGPGLPFDLVERLVSMEVAARLSAPGVRPFRNLRFVRCSSARGAEVMSWPPQQTDSMEFSVTIKIRVQKQPFTVEPTVHLSFGIRRWMPVQGRITVGRANPAYVALEPRSMDSEQDDLVFGIANLTLARTARQPDGGMHWQAQWSPALTRVLTDAGLTHRLPAAEHLVTDPTTWLHHLQTPAAVPYRAGMLSWEKVSPGLPVIDRALLWEWAIGELAPHLRPIPSLPRAAARVYPGLTRTTDPAISPAVLADVVGPRLTIELCNRTTEGFEYAMIRLGQLLGIDFPDVADALRGESGLDFGPIIVTIRRTTPPAATTDLVADRLGTEAMAQTYARHLTRHLDPAAEPTVVLVESAFEDLPGSRPGDLRTALRHALAATRRLSGFAVPAVALGEDGPVNRRPRGDSDRARFARAVDDLFRQLGIRPTPLPTPAPKTLTRSPTQLAIWMMTPPDYDPRRGRPLPLAVLIDPTGQHVQIRTPELPWQPLHTGLLALTGQHDAASGRSDADTLRFIREVIVRTATAHPDTLLLTCAENLRHIWPYLTNTGLDIDTIDLGDKPRPISMLPGLRHVRVSTGQYGETPQSHGTNGTTIGQPKGLWRYPEPRRYASTTGKPPHAAEARLHNSKITDGHRYGKATRINTRAQVWNEQLLELAVAGLQPGDHPDHWAAAVHNLRDAAPFIHWSTALPLALQVAQQTEDYYPYR